MSTNTSSGALNVATAAALEAGKHINQQIAKLDRIEVQSRPNDEQRSNWVSSVDTQAEQLIIEALDAAYKDYRIHAREAGEIVKGDAGEYTWLIEPLNGTLNFIHGHPHCAVGLALQQKGETLLAVVYDPFRNELFTARNGGGAQLDGRRIRISEVSRLRDGLLCTALPRRGSKATKQWLKTYAGLLPRAQSIHQTSAPLLDLAFLACGRYDAYWGFGLNHWESTIGSLIVREAGGLIHENAGNISAGTPKIQEKLRYFTQNQLD